MDTLPLQIQVLFCFYYQKASAFRVQYEFIYDFVLSGFTALLLSSLLLFCNVLAQSEPSSGI